MRDNLYLETAKYYDGGSFRNFSEDIQLYKHYIKKGFDILDIGCGTGRVAVELIKEEVNIFGIDLSSSMLEIFKSKIEKLTPEEKARIQIMEADMTNYQLEKEFDLIIFPFRVFQALTTDEQRVNCLHTAKRHLKPDGKIIINAFEPNHELLNNIRNIDKIDYEYYDEELKAKIRRRSKGEDNDSILQIVKSKYIFEVQFDNGHQETVEERIILGYKEKEEMDNMFKENDLNIEKLYSWWDLSEYNPDKKRELIYVLTK